jgi:hypothetical protein
MVNIFFEIEKLRAALRSRGVENQFIDEIAHKAEREISHALQERLDSAMEIAIQSGVQKESPEFINDLRPRLDAFIIDTSSGSTDFSDPPLPMLDRLLARGAKPMKDGSGVYKIIPVGGNNSQRKLPVHANIFDAQKAISAERYENAVAQYNKVTPKNSKVNFRTATSKQNRQTQWVLPEKKKDFTEDLAEVNNLLLADHDSIVLEIIRSYEEGI